MSEIQEWLLKQLKNSVGEYGNIHGLAMWRCRDLGKPEHLWGRHCRSVQLAARALEKKALVGINPGKQRHESETVYLIRKEGTP